MTNTGYINSLKDRELHLSVSTRKDAEVLSGLQEQLRKHMEELELIRKVLEINDAGSTHRAALNLSFEDQVAEMMREHDGPMHISDIETQLRKQGILIPGKGTVSNIVSRLSRAQELFTRIGRGTYSLVEDADQSQKD